MFLRFKVSQFGHGLKSMPEKSRLTPRIQIFRPSEYDREQIERAREVINFAKQVLAESDPSILLGGYYASQPPSMSE